MKTICLASQSKDRRDLFEGAYLRHFIVPTDIDESKKDGERPYDYVERLAAGKAHTANAMLAMLREAEPSKNWDADLVVAADTIAEIDGEILGKPRDEKDAVEMIKKLQGREHTILSGICVLDTKTTESRTLVVSSTVKFAKMTDEEIRWYIEEFRPLTYAGGYEMNSISSWFIESVTGSPSNVRGLPMSELKQLMSELKHRWEDYVL